MGYIFILSFFSYRKEYLFKISFASGIQNIYKCLFIICRMKEIKLFANIRMICLVDIIKGQRRLNTSSQMKEREAKV